jgi:hypothetical protein
VPLYKSYAHRVPRFIYELDKKNSMTQETNLQFSPTLTTVFADDIFIDNSIKVHIDKKDEQEIVEKIGKVTLLTFDQQTKTVNGRVMMDVITAKKLAKTLTGSIEALEKELASKEIPKGAQKPDSHIQTSSQYIG